MNQRTDKFGYDVDHIAVAVHDLEAVSNQYVETLGAKILHDEIVESQGVKVRFLQCGNSTYELLQPLSESSPVFRFLESRGEGLHHIAFRVDDIQLEYDRLKAQGLQLLQDAPIRGARNKLIFFIHPRDMGGMLTELCQPTS